MSIQAFLFRQVIRRSIKSPAVMGTIKNPMIPTEMGIAGVRGGINEALARITRVPPFVQVQDVDVGGVPAEWIRVPESDKDAVLIYLHGGAYVMGSAETHRNLAWRLAVKARCRVLLVDYRLAPEHPYPAPVEDAIAAYDWVLEQGFDPSRIGIAGDSAGGGSYHTWCIDSDGSSRGTAIVGRLTNNKPWGNCSLGEKVALNLCFTEQWTLSS